MTATGAARDFPVVCVGGSAGGLDAYIRLLRHLPADMGVAIVIVNHLSPHSPSRSWIPLTPNAANRIYSSALTEFEAGGDVSPCG